MIWTRSSRCASDDPVCVEVALPADRDDQTVAVRDGKRGWRSPILETSPAAWRLFVRGLSVE